MNEIITQVCTIVGTALSIVVALMMPITWLIKHLMESSTTKEISRYNHELDATNKREADKFNHSLKTKEFEHQIQFSKVYEKQLNLIADVCETLSNVEMSLLDTVMPLRLAGGRTEEEDFKDFAEHFNKGIIHFQRNRVYLPADIADEVLKLFNFIKQHATTWQILHPFKQGAPRRSDEQFEKWQASIELIQKEVPELRKKLENRFREIMNYRKSDNEGN